MMKIRVIRALTSLIKRCVVLALVLPGCAHPSAAPTTEGPSSATPRRPAVSAEPVAPAPTLGGIAKYDGGEVASGAAIAITDLGTGEQLQTIYANGAGGFKLVVPAGDYAIAATTETGFAWIERTAAPNVAIEVKLSQDCQVLHGRVSHGDLAPEVQLVRRSSFTGDTFMRRVAPDGTFAACLPVGRYLASATGAALSVPRELAVPAAEDLALESFPRQVVEAGLPEAPAVQAELDGLVSDIAEARPAIIGLGEATHGSAELVTTRGELTMALVHKLGTRLLLFEFDAIAAVALDDYVTSGRGDLRKTIEDLGFWTTNTEEFVAFAQSVRDYNQHSSDPIHIWGVDVQNTERPSTVLLQDAAALGIGKAEQASLRSAAAQRGKGFAELPPGERTQLDALLTRLSTPKGRARRALLVAVAARSLRTPFGYWDSDPRARRTERRDRGMAELASFVLSRIGKGPACLWAHDAHVAHAGNTPQMGSYLAKLLTGAKLRYYAVGFYVAAGSTRAWDRDGKIGVISHAIQSRQRATTWRNM